MKGIMRKIIAVVAVLSLALCVINVAPYAASADIAVRVGKTTYMQDDEFTAEIYFPKSYNKVAALDMSLSYDTTKLEIVKVTPGKGLRKARDKQVNGEVFSENHNIAGKVNWCLSGGNNYVFSNDFAQVTFKVKPLAEHGSCDLKLKINNAYNSGFVDMTDKVTASNATFTILRNTVNDLTLKLNKDGNGYIITDYLCMTYDTVNIPDEYKGLPIVGIEYAAFMNHAEIKNLTLPSRLQYIGRESFAGCSGIKELVIPQEVTLIDESAFERCTGIEKLTLPLGLETIAMSAFKGCIRITDVELPFTLKKLGVAAFRDCYTLNTVKISKNTSIGKNAFASCDDGLRFITVADNKNLASYIDSSETKPKTEIVKDISLGTLSGVPEQQYTKSEITPAAEIKLTNGAKVEFGKDYRIVYVRNTDIGTAKMYVAGINGYGEGYVTTFEIVCKHPEVSKVISKEASCTTKGNYVVTCKLCGEKFDEEIPAKGHTPSGEWVIKRRPTITKTGEKYMLCTVCRFRVNITELPKAYPDVNGDGKINSADALIVLQYSVDLNDTIKTEEQFMNADTNGDGRINSVDALTILKISVGMEKI